MLKFITGLPSIQKWLIIGLSVALLATITGSGITFWFLNKTINKRDQIIENKNTEIIALNVDVQRWKDSTNSLADLVQKQNISIQKLATLGNEARERAAEAIKNIKPIVQARRAQKNKPINSGVELNTCEAAIERQKTALAWSLL